MWQQSVESTMLDTSHMDLHELARAYADGRLEFEQYRSARTQLIDRVTGEATIVVRQTTRPVVHASHVAHSEERVTHRRLDRRVLRWLTRKFRPGRR
jgi:hypothetical protein